jgi:hypothetical protein
MFMLKKSNPLLIKRDFFCNHYNCILFAENTKQSMAKPYLKPPIHAYSIIMFQREG